MQLAEYTTQQMCRRERMMQEAYEQSLFPRESLGERSCEEEEDWRAIWNE